MKPPMMVPYSKMVADLRKIFFERTDSILEQVDEQLRFLERHGDTDTLAMMARMKTELVAQREKFDRDYPEPA